MGYITKIDAVRQLKQFSGTTIVLSGSTNIKENLTVIGNFSGGTISGGTLFSGSSDIDTLFIHKGVYEDFYIDAIGFTELQNSGATQNSEEYTGTSLNTDNLISDYFSFTAQTRDEAIQARLKFPDIWDLGTIKAKIYWDTDVGSRVGDGVTWGVKGGSLSNSDVLSGETIYGTEVNVSDTIINPKTLHISSASTTIAIGGNPILNDLIYLQVSRKVNDGNDISTKSAKFLGMSIQYKQKLTGTTQW